MSEGRICDNCRTASADHRAWVRLQDGAQQVEANSYAALLFGGPSAMPALLDFCGWRCVQDYAVVKALETEPSA